MKEYVEPTFDLIEMTDEIITTSGTETRSVESSDGIWNIS